MSTLLAVDGSSVFMRALSVLPEDKRTVDDLEYMTISMLRKAVRVAGADNLVVALDSIEQCWRCDVHPAYKADRAYSDLRPKQLTPMLLPRLTARGIATSYNARMEADDLLCTLAFTLKHAAGHNLVVYTRDSDLHVLTSFPNVTLLWPENGGNLLSMDHLACTAKLGYEPSWLPAMRALTADTKDNMRALLDVPDGWRCPLTKPRAIELMKANNGEFYDVMFSAVNGDCAGMREKEIEYLNLYEDPIGGIYYAAQLSRNADLNVDARLTRVGDMDLSVPKRED